MQTCSSCSPRPCLKSPYLANVLEGDPSSLGSRVPSRLGQDLCVCGVCGLDTTPRDSALLQREDASSWMPHCEWTLTKKKDAYLLRFAFAQEHLLSNLAPLFHYYLRHFSKNLA